MQSGKEKLRALHAPVVGLKGVFVLFEHLSILRPSDLDVGYLQPIGN